MIRKGLLIAFLGLGLTHQAQAADSSDGCGAGWYVASDTSLLSTLVRGVTNAFLPPTFSMTTGISNCAQHSLVLEEQRSYHFLAANLDQVRADMARGQGIYLDAFAMTLGCDEEAVPSVGSLLRQHYQTIFSDASSAQQSLQAARSVIANEGAAMGCGATQG